METGEARKLTKNEMESNEDKSFYKYAILSSLFPLIGLYFSITCEKKLSRVAAQIGGGISCVVYGVYMVALSMYLTSLSYQKALDGFAGSPEVADSYASSMTDSQYYVVLGLPAWIAIFLGSWVVNTSLGNYYRDNGQRIVNILEMDTELLKRCCLPIVGIAIASILYKNSKTKFLTGAVGSCCTSIALAPIMFLIGESSPKNLTVCTLLFLLLAIVGGIGLGIFWWKLRVLVLSFQTSRESGYRGHAEEANSRVAIEAGIQGASIASVQAGDEFSNLIDNAQEPSANDIYAPPAPTSHVAIEDYRAQEEDEMNFQNGDLIGIEKDYGDGWAIGQNISKNRKRGVFPLNLVTAIVTGPTQNVSRKKTSFLPRTISMKVKLSTI